MIELVKQLSGRRCFVLAKLEARANGKVDKIPVNTELLPCNAQDPKNWLTGEEAEGLAGLLGCGIGIVISEGSGLFCVDIDGALVDNAWTPLAIDLFSRFPGAYFERSVSGKGAHIIGTTTPVPEHRSKNVELHIECYTRLRFIYLGDYMQGDANTDHTIALASLIAQHFGEAVTSLTDWTDTAQGGDPIEDDQQLLMMLANVRSSSVFGGRATFSELWNGNEAALAKSFPPNDADTYDRSSADMSLAQRLAWATGSNCERVLRIMQQCPGLTRDKWSREDYLPRTIMRACAQQQEWYVRKQAATATAPPLAAPAPPPSTASEGSPAVPPPPPAPLTLGADLGITTVTQQIEQFEGMVYVRDSDRMQLADGSVVKREQLDNFEGGRLYVLDAEGKTTASTWDAFTKNQMHKFPRVLTQFFDPRVPLGTIRHFEGQSEVNCYRPIETKSIEGDPAPFLDLVKRMLPNGRDAEILLSYMAAVVQYPGKKFMWCPYIQGTRGNGKTTLLKVMEHCVSFAYTHRAKATEIGEKFNSVFVNKLLVCIDEVRGTDKRDLEEELKPLITSERIETRPMYAEKVMRAICFNVMIFSNYKDGIRIDADERRYAPLFCAQQHKPDLEATGLTRKFFRELNDWFDKRDGYAIVNHYLRTLAIADDFNPATECTTAPETTSTAEAATASLGPLEQELAELILSERDGFRNGWGSSVVLDFVLNAQNRGKGISRQVRAQIWDALGYVPHPSLPEGRIGAEGFLDQLLGARVLYIKRGHALAKTGMSPDQVRAAYLSAQQQAGLPPPPT